ncbi:MAG: hypothetical protein M3170_08840, partial [Candidatus Dormibacteraeota bacterium]|nr:hypothetical protein [Candidatus Dormibacteraeota bacterium]
MLKGLTMPALKQVGSLSPSSNRVKLIAAIVLAALVVAAVGVGAWSYTTANQAAVKYDQERGALVAQLRAARDQGYTNQDLAPITNRLNALNSAAVPWFLPSRPSHYKSALSQTLDLEQQLRTIEQQQLSIARDGSTQQLAAAGTAANQAQQAQAADTDIQALQQRIDNANKALGAAHNVRDYRGVFKQSQGIAADATNLLNQTQQENLQIQQAAQQLVASTGGNV